MIYTKREKLSVIVLEEETDSISVRMLSRIIAERPSNVIYCELNHKLYGIISMGDIARACRKNSSCVAVNKNYSFVSKEEYAKARKIFREQANRNAFPVVDNAHKLVGEYSRWDDLFCEKSGRGGLEGGHYSQIVVVKPSEFFEKKKMMFLNFRKQLTAQGIYTDCIAFDEITEYLDKAPLILFMDEDERRAAETLFSFIQRKDLGKTVFCTLKEFILERRYDLNHETMNRYIKNIGERGVYVLNLVIEENAGNEEYFRRLNTEIQAKYDLIGKEAVNKVYPEMYRDFFDDLYTEAYADSLTHLNYAVETISGFKMLKDCRSRYYNVVEGERYTFGQPGDYERTVYFVGPCYIYGHHVEDRYTIESILQERFNQNGEKVRVVNCGSVYSAENKCFAWMRIKSLPLRKGDIIVYGGDVFENAVRLNLLDVCKEYGVTAKWMTNAPGHCNHKINRLYADAIYRALETAVEEKINEQRSFVEENEDFVKTVYINRYFRNFDVSAHDKIGSIVMNCNPFTYGHRYLIEQALKTADYLIIFVVEEDRSLFTFTERFAMVCEGTADMENVFVVPSGPFILSQTTFPEYFIKEMDEDIVKNVENDITLFAERIAPYLNIRYRFVGEEPEDKVTKEYNLAMKRILPLKGIQVSEIPRKKRQEKYISATAVRKYLEEYRLDELSGLVPESTMRILFAEND